MSAHAWIQTSRGRAFDLLNPRAEDIDLLGEVADVLARTPRFNGHVPAGPYSVAQHSVLGAEAILRDRTERSRGAVELARAFILHDVHEFAVGDIVTPVADALEALCGVMARHGAQRDCLPEPFVDQAARNAPRHFRQALATLKRQVDIAVHQAAGFPWPLDPEIAVRVREWDLRMLASERRQLLGPTPKPWHPVVEAAKPAPIKGRIKVQPWPEAADSFRKLMLRLFPHLKKEQE